MEHRGIRYTIRIGIARQEWRVVIHIPDKRLPVERVVFGTWEDAKTEARSMINAWMKKRDKARGSPTNVANLPDLLSNAHWRQDLKSAPVLGSRSRKKDLAE